MQPTTSHLNPLRLLQILEEILPEDSILIADGGDFVATASYILRPRGTSFSVWLCQCRLGWPHPFGVQRQQCPPNLGPLRWLDPGPFGTLGVGAGFAIGAKMVSPSSQV